ncbi:MAG: hypothetical protein LBK76_05020 [Verrucomicrobiales bacterium]|jgi:hypothetical protein|nr:hypothetical protein [Verrucomicrobiales bacterium]
MKAASFYINMFKKHGPQKVQHIIDNYIVQTRDRYTVEYLKDNKKVTIGVDFGFIIYVFQGSMRGWLNLKEYAMGQDEQIIVLGRIVAGLNAMGCEVEVCSGNAP